MQFSSKSIGLLSKMVIKIQSPKDTRKSSSKKVSATHVMNQVDLQLLRIQLQIYTVSTCHLLCSIKEPLLKLVRRKKCQQIRTYHFKNAMSTSCLQMQNMKSSSGKHHFKHNQLLVIICPMQNAIHATTNPIWIAQFPKLEKLGLKKKNRKKIYLFLLFLEIIG